MLIVHVKFIHVKGVMLVQIMNILIGKFGMLLWEMFLPARESQQSGFDVLWMSK